MADKIPKRAVDVMVRVKVDGKWKRLLAAYGKNGKIRPSFGIVDGKPVEFPKPTKCELRIYEGRQPKYIAAGYDATDADARRKVEEGKPSKTTVARDAAKADLVVVDKGDRQTIATSAAEYIRDAEQRGVMEAASQARLVCDEFRTIINRKSYVDEIERADIFRFHAALKKRGCAPRTIANKHERVRSWLLYAGIDKTILPPTPKYEETNPTIYMKDEISTMLAEANPYMRMVILLASKCGLRDQELMHLEFSDINFHDKTLRVQGKPRWGFTVKTQKQRDVPIPDDVLDELRSCRDHHPGQSLVLASRNGTPNTKLLKALKTLARQAKLNCGHCEGCKSSRRECEKFTLHKFRRTYLTMMLRGGIDLRTVQSYAGHSDIASTMRYLSPESAKDAQAKLNAVWQ